MKKSEAEKVTKLLSNLQVIEKKQDHFTKTKEFCCIDIIGENGAEQEYHINLHYKNDTELIDELRDHIECYYNHKKISAEAELKNL